MDFRKGLIVVSLCIALPALAEIRTMIEAIEAKPSNMTVPTTNSSRLSYRTCEECDLATVRLTPETTFSINGKTVEFGDFRKAFLVVRQRRNGYALISIHKDTQTVTSIQVAN